MLKRKDRQAAAALTHPNIVSIHNVGLNDGSPYIITELLQGETPARGLKKGPMRLSEAPGHATEKPGDWVGRIKWDYSR